MEVTHTPQIPQSTSDAIHHLGGRVLEVLEHRATKNSDKYQEALNKLPDEHRDSYGELVAHLGQYIVQLFDLRRGVEGLADLTSNHWKIQTSGGLTFFVKVCIFDILISFKDI